MVKCCENKVKKGSARYHSIPHDEATRKAWETWISTQNKKDFKTYNGAVLSQLHFNPDCFWCEQLKRCSLPAIGITPGEISVPCPSIPTTLGESSTSLHRDHESVDEPSNPPSNSDVAQSENSVNLCSGILGSPGNASFVDEFHKTLCISFTSALPESQVSVGHLKFYTQGEVGSLLKEEGRKIYPGDTNEEDFDTSRK